jgi:hypothetical protein
MDSRINLEVYKLHAHEDNSPQGLLNIAMSCIVASRENPTPKYSFQENDEVWIVLDTDPDKTDSRTPQLQMVREECKQRKGWNIALSNPCFEVWLYFHSESRIPTNEGLHQCKSWKKIVSESFPGGFDSKRYPIFIEEATKRTAANFKLHDGQLVVGCTEVFKLSRRILPLIKSKLDTVKRKVDF